MARVLVCGGRNYSSPAQVFSELARLHKERRFTALIHGGATGADKFASEWARTRPEIRAYVCRAEWEKHGRYAGPLRNARMLEWKPDLVVAFPGGAGTANMVSQARAARVEVIEVFSSSDIPDGLKPLPSFPSP